MSGTRVPGSLVYCMAFAAMSMLAESWSADFSVSTAEEFASAVSAINSGGAGTHTISLQGDITDFPGATFGASGTDTKLLGNGHRLVFMAPSSFCVTNGAVLRIGSADDSAASALDMTRAKSNDVPGVLSVGDKGTVHIHDGVVLHDCEGNNYFGGGVSVEGGLFHMHGGTIRNCGINGGSVCFGGGVAVVYGGRFIMDGGTIKDCYVLGPAGDDEKTYPYRSLLYPWTAGGGVFVSYIGSFEMNGGVIEGCSADVADPETSSTSDGVGGGVAVCTSYATSALGYLDAEFVMKGGVIKGCRARSAGGGVVAGLREAFFSVIGTYPPAWVDGHSARVSLVGGMISGCSSDDGGGVFLMWIRPNIPVTMGAVTICDCEAEYGGGIEVYSYWTQLMMDGTSVTGNTAAHAAGVLLNGNKDGGTIGTTMKDVSVTDNVATDADGVGGIYYSTDSKLTISGAMDVSGNVAGNERKDSNLYCQGNTYPFYISGSLEGSTIGLTDPLLDAGGADSDVFLSSGYNAQNPGVHPYARVFTSDHEGWYADYGDPAVTTTTTSMQETTTRVDSSAIKCNWYLYAYTAAHDMRYRTQLYWNNANQCLTATQSGNLTAGQIQLDGKSYIAAYSNSGAVYTIRTLKEFPADLNLSSYPKLSSFGLAMDSTIPSDRTDAYSGSLTDGYSTITYNVVTMKEVTTTTSTPDYSAEVRLVKGGAKLTGARQRYPWNNFIDFSWTAEGRAGGWLFDFSVEDLVQKDATAAVTLKSVADTALGAGDVVAGENRVAWDAVADGFARMATNCVVTMRAYRDADERAGGTPFVTDVVSNLAFDTHYDFTAGGQGVRLVSNPLYDILPIAFSTTNWVWKGTDVAPGTDVYVVPAMTNAVGALYDAGPTNLVNSASGEGAFDWHERAFDFVKFIHSNEFAVATAYFKYPPFTTTVVQRHLEGRGIEGDDAKREIVLDDDWFAMYGVQKIGASDAELQRMLDDLDSMQPNGCRHWENVVLGNMETNLLVMTGSESDGGRLAVCVPVARSDAASRYGYSVLFELRREDGGKVVLQRAPEQSALGIPLYPDDRDDVRNPTGLYRLYSLVVPNSDLAVTNEIPSTNVIGVLKVASALRNTITAVPWKALASDPASASDVMARAALHSANISPGDDIVAWDFAKGMYRAWTRSAGGWEAVTTVAGGRDGVRMEAAEIDGTFVPGSAFWVCRGSPCDLDGKKPKPYFLYGQFKSGDYTCSIPPGSAENPSSMMCANPTAYPVAINDISFEGTVGADDTLVLPNDGDASTVCVRNGQRWGYWRKQRYGAAVKSVWAEDVTIGPGTGFWYVRRSQGELAAKWPAWGLGE